MNFFSACASKAPAHDVTPSAETTPELYQPTLQFLHDYFGPVAAPSSAPGRLGGPPRTDTRPPPPPFAILVPSTADGEAAGTELATQARDESTAPSHAENGVGDAEEEDGVSTIGSIAPVPLAGGHYPDLRALTFLDTEIQRQKTNGVALYNADGSAIAAYGDTAAAASPTGQGGKGSKPSSDDVSETTGLLYIFLLLCRLAAPVALSQLLRGSMGFISTIFMGHYLTTNLFAAATTGLAFTNLTALSIGSGFCAALDTLATQEHGRRKHSPEIAAILMRSLLCTFVIYIPMAILYTFSAPVLALIIHKDLVQDTAFFLRMSVFIIVPMLFTNNFLKFAQSQRVTQMSVITTAVSAVSLPIFLFAFGRGGTLGGIILAMSLSRCVELSIVLYYVASHAGLRGCFQGRTAKQHLSALVTNTSALTHFICVGLPVLAGFCADSWSFEVLSIVCAHIGPMCSALWGVAMSLYNVLFALGYGVASAGAIRVGNAIGARKGLLAHKYSIAVLMLSVSTAVPCALLIGVFGGPIYALMQSNAEVTARGREAAPVIAVAFFFDTVFYCLEGSFRGIGENKVLLFIICISMWGLAVPLGAILGVSLHYDFEGVMIGIGVGVASAIPLELGYLNLLFDWSQHQGPRAVAQVSV